MTLTVKISTVKQITINFVTMLENSHKYNEV